MEQCSREEVHLWQATLDEKAVKLSAFEPILSHDERIRAARFVLKSHKNHFVMSRNILQNILGRYLNEDPHELLFKYGPFGKPALESSVLRGGDVRFNVAHSAGILLIAVSVGRELGVDVERIQPGFLNQRIIEQVFSEQEQVHLYGVTEALRVKRFFEGWTRKEAFLKALGVGLSVQMNRVESMADAEEALGPLMTHQTTHSSEWVVNPLRIDKGYCACLVVEGHGWKLKRFQFRIEGMADL